MPAAAPPVLPRHVAITMDGNGRWAAARALPRIAGHRAGLKPVRMCIEACAARAIEALTLFAFSSENWGRPAAEVGKLMGLFLESLEKEIDELHAKDVRVRFVGARERIGAGLRQRIEAAEQRTGGNSGLCLQIAMSYGGRWDIVQAARRLAAACVNGRLRAEEITETSFGEALALAGLPPPDLLIRTGGEQRLSNFLLWDAAYSELFFTPTLWPDFALSDFRAALDFFAARERRFGKTKSQRAS
ncbi:MAG: di-trans,poly-cis-decaprenylcistransferase [Gammaproteobacteria bacterium]|nr:di-trans,poly-cis-decaprenylcistransferase [Gammaproteobacteria bacterium]